MDEGAAQGKRTREIEDVTNLYVIHPLSRVLVPWLARMGVRPNTVSLMGMAFGAGAALAYAHYEQWPMAVLGFLLMVAWHVMDGADGQLARLTGQTSEIGKVLDGLCDHVTFLLVYISLSVVLMPVYGAWIWALSVLAGVSHVVQSSAYEFQRQAYDHWVHGKPTARLVQPADIREALRNQRGVAVTFGRLHAVYVALQNRVAAVDKRLFARLGLLVDRGRADIVRVMYRDANVAGVRRWAILSSNYRTIALFLVSLAGLPVLFFLFEIVLLNAVLWLLTRVQWARHRALSDLIDRAVDVETVEGIDRVPAGPIL